MNYSTIFSEISEINPNVVHYFRLDDYFLNIVGLSLIFYLGLFYLSIKEKQIVS